MDKWGYTGSACLPMALDDAVKMGRLHDGDLVVMTGSGAGLAMGCIALEWNTRRSTQVERVAHRGEAGEVKESS